MEVINFLFLTNTGNRNLLYKGQEISVYLNQNNLRTESYRSITEKLLVNFDSEKDNFKLNILPDILQKYYHSGGRKCILFSTDQPHSQDTIFSTEIIKRLIECEYPEVQIFICCIKCNIVLETEKLCAYYQSQIRNALTQDSDTRFWITDAGGTPQQQAVMKLVSELMIPEKNRFMVYLSKSGNHTEVVERNNAEYKTVILAEQCRGLIKAGYYSAAAELFERMSGNPCILKLLKLAEARITRNESEFRKISISNKCLQMYPDWKLYHEGLLTPVPNLLVDYLNSYQYSELYELLMIARFRLECKDYTQFLFYAYLFHEQLTFILIKYFFKLERRDDFEKCRIQLKKIFKQIEHEGYIQTFLSKNNTTEIEPNQISFLLYLSQNCDNTVWANIINDFVSLNDLLNPELSSHKGSWRTLRNQYAHRGIVVRYEMLDEICPELIPAFNRWLTLFHADSDSLYLKFNNTLSLHLGQQIQFTS